MDKDSGSVHSSVVISANVHDVTQTGNLLHGSEEEVYGDSGYLGGKEYVEDKSFAKKIEWEINMRPSSIRKIGGNEQLIYQCLESLKSSVRAKEEVSIEDFYTKGKNDESEWPFIHICINSESMLLNIAYETEYDILIEILRDIKFNVIGGMNLVLYFVNNNQYDLISQDFSNRSSMDSGFDQLSGSEQKIYITKGSSEEFYITRGRGFAEKQMSINEYIQKRKEIDENE